MTWAPLVFVSWRYLRRRRRTRGVGAPLLALASLTAGVLALNAVLAVMNGFQLTFIESLVELSSSHLRWTPPEGQAWQAGLDALRQVPGVRSAVASTESQTLIANALGERRGAVLRGFPPDLLVQDPGLGSRLGLGRPLSGAPRLPGPGQVVVGSELARALGLAPGDRVDLTSLAGPGFSLLSPHQVNVEVLGTFTSGYYEIDASWALISLEDSLASFTNPGDLFVAVKLDDANHDLSVAAAAAQSLGRPPREFTTWRDYNRGFFGALRTEKTVMLVLVGLIFLVVGVNLYFSQSRAVREHAEDLALWVAVGVTAARARLVFALEGLMVGLGAAALGTGLGLGAAWAFGALPLLPADAFYLPVLPSRVVPAEVAGIAAACVCASTLAGWLASRQNLGLSPSQALKVS